MDHIVVDVEIQNLVNGPEGFTWDDTDKLGVACAVVYEYESDRYRIFGPEDVPALRDRLLRADRVTTFNGWKFDFPVIWATRNRAATYDLKQKSDDLLRRIWQAVGADPDGWGPLNKGWSLDNVTLGTLKRQKIGHGAEAPKWFKQGLWAKVANYCVDDVALERDLCNWIDRNHYVINGVTEQRVQIPDWRPGQ